MQTSTCEYGKNTKEHANAGNSLNQATYIFQAEKFTKKYLRASSDNGQGKGKH